MGRLPSLIPQQRAEVRQRRTDTEGTGWTATTPASLQFHALNDIKYHPKPALKSSARRYCLHLILRQKRHARKQTHFLQ